MIIVLVAISRYPEHKLNILLELPNVDLEKSSDMKYQNASP